MLLVHHALQVELHCRWPLKNPLFKCNVANALFLWTALWQHDGEKVETHCCGGGHRMFHSGRSRPLSPLTCQLASRGMGGIGFF